MNGSETYLEFLSRDLQNEIVKESPFLLSAPIKYFSDVLDSDKSSPKLKGSTRFSSASVWKLWLIQRLC